jgi:hypothetical protein
VIHAGEKVWIDPIVSGTFSVELDSMMSRCPFSASAA